MLSRRDGKHAVWDNAAAQKRIPCNRLGAVDRIYGNKGITLLLLDEPLTIPFEVPRGEGTPAVIIYAVTSPSSPSHRSTSWRRRVSFHRGITRTSWLRGLRLRKPQAGQLLLARYLVYADRRWAIRCWIIRMSYTHDSRAALLNKRHSARLSRKVFLPNCNDNDFSRAKRVRWKGQPRNSDGDLFFPIFSPISFAATRRVITRNIA